jgi:hypothetical protein
MKKYKVTIPEVHTVIVEVVANDEKEAFEKAEQDVAINGESMSAVYEHTMGKNHWTSECLGDAPEVEEFPYNPFEGGEISDMMEESYEL